MQTGIKYDGKNPDELLKILLSKIGLSEGNEIETFLNPNYESGLHDPFLMPDMKKAVSRIITAIKNNEKTVVYSDYDADGIPGAVILHDFFNKIGYKNFINYIPHRHDEGFGLNHDAIDQFINDKTNLLITIDCGITDIEEVARAKGAKIDVIITDHHLPHEKLPDAYAIVNPKVKDSVYPFKELCGAGVVFKLIQALIFEGNFIKDGKWKAGQEKWLLDMVGLATLSDMVPLTGENRVLAHFGLKVLRLAARPGLLRLFRRMNIDPKNVSEDDITFMVTPRINAASRLGHPMDAFLMLVGTRGQDSGSSAEAISIDKADYLISLNDERKKISASMTRLIKSHLVKNSAELKRIIVYGDSEWKPGVVGLVAGSIADEYKRPVFLWGRDGGEVIKGSVRSGGEVNIVQLMEKVKHLFIDFGGHRASGGFSIALDKIDLLDSALNKAYEDFFLKNEVEKIDNGIEQSFDIETEINHITPKLFSALEKLSPFGVGNKKPIFKLSKVSPKAIYNFGKEKNHLEISFGGSNNLRGIAFFKKDDDFKALKNNSVDIYAHLEKSFFRNRPEVRLRIVNVL